ncbi:GDSL esterase/lipase 3-like [Cucurbita pepo subsp. pepo]|uniref:GDSL esterase/lipase 3-like n=1 Tax=Cucurbita pepo subsp. pepo TaxID=3664 RepID=UPI000C9D2FA2|nr:GDSL esterase/lipase 3-like [Cucurbita pepo subsp. pepo]
MMFPNLGSCFFFILFAALCGFPTISKAVGIQLGGAPSSENRFGFFIFGDSYVDVGNNNYINTTSDFQANFPPYGESFFPVATGRFTDGRNIPDFLGEYANLPLLPPYLDPHNDLYDYGVNFASGGGGALALSHQEQALGLQTQMKFFKRVDKSLRKKLGNARTQSFFSNSVFLFNFGGNDYLNPFDISYDIFKTIDAQEQYVNMVIGNITMALKEVYKHGGRKFGLMGVPPLGYMPSSRLKKSAQFFEEASSIARLHNKLLPIALHKLSKQLKEFKYAFADTHTLLLQRILNPLQYGFKVVDTACCGSDEFRGVYNCGRKLGSLPFTHCKNLEDHMFFDSFHPTEKVFKQLAEQMWSGGLEVVKPYNFKQLFEYEPTLASE